MAEAQAVSVGWAEEELRAPQKWRTLRQLLRRKLAVIALAYLLVFYAAGVLAPVIPGIADPNEQHFNREERFAGPSLEHPLGQDALGRDLLARVIYSARTTIVFTVAVMVTGSFVLGLGLGLLAGYKGGWVDTTIMRVGEVVGGIPTIVLVLAITASFRTRMDTWSFWLEDHTWLGDDARTLVKFTIIIGATVPFAWIGSSRIVRSQVLAIREMQYVEAAEQMGASTGRILWRHIFPGVLPLYIVGVSGGMAGIALIEVSLSYLGLGIDAPTASFGNLIDNAQGLRQLKDHPHLLPAVSTPVVLFLFAWNLLGDAMVDVIQPRDQRRSA